MYCKECGSLIPEGGTFCPKCGASVNDNQNGTQGKTCPETYLARAIVFTILCCWPFGIPAIVNAAGVENAFHSGNYLLAVEKSQKAAKWCKITLIVGIAFWVLYGIMIAIAAACGYDLTQFYTYI